MPIFVLIVSLLAIIITFLPLIPSDLWIVRIFDFPRLQITFFLIICFIGVYFFLSKIKLKVIVMCLLAGAVVYQSTLIAKYTFLSGKEVLNSESTDPQNKISILISNVYMDNTNSEEFLNIIKQKNPDIIITVETNMRWANELMPLDKIYSYSVKYPLENTYGMLLFSKLKLIDPKVKFLIEDDIPSIHTIAVLPSGKQIKLYSLHPEPPVPSESTTSEERDAELIVIAKEAEKQKIPVIVGGDLNDVAWSHTTRLFQRISGLLDPRVGRGFYNTYNANIFLARWPLDHIFHSHHFKLDELELLPNFGSDHFPIYAKLSFEEDADDEQEKKLPENDDRKEAEETINESR
jgi:endonuclease/exonuclease/phosphatase (EEP) superfamily protein YafD